MNVVGLIARIRAGSFCPTKRTYTAEEASKIQQVRGYYVTIRSLPTSDGYAMVTVVTSGVILRIHLGDLLLVPAIITAEDLWNFKPPIVPIDPRSLK